MADIFAPRASAEAVVGEAVEEWREEGREEGIEIGEARSKIAMARTILNEGLEVALIARVTGLSKGQIPEIPNDLE